ncbi:MAG: ABC transporter substrate-binding protein [Anaerolineaceae bacterium]
MRKRFAIAMLLVLSLSCSIPQPTITQTAVVLQEASDLRIYAGLEAPILDPARVEMDSPAGICIPFLFTPLTEVDNDGNVISGLAKSWEPSEDNRLWTFHLRPDFPWVRYNPTKGKVEAIRNVTAHDVEYSVKRKVHHYFSGDEQMSDTVWTYYNIKGARGVMDSSLLPDRLGIWAEDDYTLKVELEQPDANFPLQGRQIFPVPEEAINQFGDKWTSSENIMANGPFVPQADIRYPSQVHGIQLIETSQIGGSVERVEIVYGIQPEAALEMYKKGELDILPVQPADLPTIQQDPGLSKDLFVGPREKQVALVFNTAKPPFDNPNLVKAFSYAIDREKISQVFNGALTCTTFCPNRTSVKWKYNDELTTYSPKTAKLALEFSGVNFGAPDAPGITMSVSDDPELKAVAESLEADWKKNLLLTVGKILS